MRALLPDYVSGAFAAVRIFAECEFSYTRLSEVSTSLEASDATVTRFFIAISRSTRKASVSLMRLRRMISCFAFSMSRIARAFSSMRAMRVFCRRKKANWSKASSIAASMRCG